MSAGQNNTIDTLEVAAPPHNDALSKLEKRKTDTQSVPVKAKGGGKFNVLWRQNMSPMVKGDSGRVSSLPKPCSPGTGRSLEEGCYGTRRSKRYRRDDDVYRSIDDNYIHPDGSCSVPEGTLSANHKVPIDEIDFSHGYSFRHKNSPVIKTLVQNLNLECVKPQRAGVIIYTVVNGAIFFGLGLDSSTHDLTDFGGGVMYKTDKNAVRGALREFEEETLQIFEVITPDDVKTCPVVYDSRNLIIFVHLNLDPEAVCLRFNKRYEQVVENNKLQILSARDSGSKLSKSYLRKYRDPEVCGITWLNWEEFQTSIKQKGIMFSRVQRFLNRAGDFSYLL